MDSGTSRHGCRNPIRCDAQVTGTYYCYGRHTHTCPRQKGSFLVIPQYGGRERGIALLSDQKTRFAGFAVRTRRHGTIGRMARQRWRVKEGRERRRYDPGCVPGLQVCTPSNAKRPGKKTQCWQGFAAGSPPKSAQSVTVKTAQGSSESGHPWQPIRPRDTADRRCRCAPVPRSGRASCAAFRKSPRAPCAAANRWPASTAGGSPPADCVAPPPVRRAWCRSVPGCPP